MSFISESIMAAPTSGESVRVARWPSLLAASSAGAAALLLVLTYGRHDVPLFLVGYLLGAVVTPIAAVLHRFYLFSRQTSLWFVRNLVPGRIVVTALIIGLAAGMVHAWWLATELAKK